MTPLGNSCNSDGSDIRIEGLQDGKLVVAGKVLSATDKEGLWPTPLAPRFGAEVAPSVLPDRTFDMNGIEWSGVTQQILDAVAAKFTPSDPAGPWGSDDSAAGPVHVFTTPPAAGAPSSAYPENGFIVLAADPDPATRPWGLVRIWHPAPDAQVTREALYAALEEKYGTASAPVLVGHGFGSQDTEEGLIWSFDPEGNPQDAQWANYCARKYPRGFDSTALHYAELDNLAGVPDLELPSRAGCGFQFVVRHHPVDRPTDPVSAVLFAFFDPQDVVLRAWQRETAGFADRLAGARARIEAARGAIAARGAKQPDL